MTERSMQEILDARADAQKWNPAQTEDVPRYIEGEIIQVKDITGGEYGDYKMITVLTDTGDAWNWHAFHTTARNFVDREQISPANEGDHLGVRYGGKTESRKKGYSPANVYNAILRRRDGTTGPPDPPGVAARFVDSLPNGSDGYSDGEYAGDPPVDPIEATEDRPTTRTSPFD